MKSAWYKIAAVFGAWTLLALILGVNRYIRLLSVGEHTSFYSAVRPGLFDYWIWAALTPLVFWLAKNIPFTRRRLWLVIAAHAVFCVAVSLLHVGVADIIGLAAPNVKGFTGSRLQARFVFTFYSDIWMYWPLVGLWNLVTYQRRFREREMRAAQLESQLARAELEALRNQLQPHFLFNTLNSISALMQDDPEAAEDMLADLSYMLRGSLLANANQEITMGREIDLLQAYLRIQRKRFEDRLEVNVDIQPETLNAVVPTLILQPLVENAIRHGITPLPRRGNISITACKKDAQLVLQVSDDGCGLAPDYKEGIGLSNTRKRLKQLYGNDAILEVRGAPQKGTVASVLLPFRIVQAEEMENENPDFDSRRRAPSPEARTLAALD